MIEVLVPPLIADAPGADRPEAAIPASFIAFSLRAVAATPGILRRDCLGVGG
jgi:hypothetical protein